MRRTISRLHPLKLNRIELIVIGWLPWTLSHALSQTKTMSHMLGSIRGQKSNEAGHCFFQSRTSRLWIITQTFLLSSYQHTDRNGAPRRRFCLAEEEGGAEAEAKAEEEVEEEDEISWRFFFFYSFRESTAIAINWTAVVGVWWNYIGCDMRTLDPISTLIESALAERERSHRRAALLCLI